MDRIPSAPPPIVDAHEDIAYHMRRFRREFERPTVPCQITLPLLKKGGVRLVFNTVFVAAGVEPDDWGREAEAQLDLYDEIAVRHAGEVYRITDADALGLFAEEGSIGLLTMMEGAEPLESPDTLEEFHRRGVRVVSLTWNTENKYASGYYTDKGLTAEGAELIRTMNELGIALDLSHINDHGFWPALELTELVPLATHSNARALCPHPRNLTDEQIRAIAERGGVVGVVLYRPFLAAEAEGTLDDVVRHVAHIASLVGEDHVGIGSDLDGASPRDFPSEIRTVADLPLIAARLAEAGFDDEAVRKVMGGNFLRLLACNLGAPEA